MTKFEIQDERGSTFAKKSLPDLPIGYPLKVAGRHGRIKDIDKSDQVIVLDTTAFDK